MSINLSVPRDEHEMKPRISVVGRHSVLTAAALAADSIRPPMQEQPGRSWKKACLGIPIPGPRLNRLPDSVAVVAAEEVDLAVEAELLLPPRKHRPRDR